MRYIGFILSLAVTVTLCVLFNYKLGPLPAMGKLLDPATGFWQNCESKSFVPGSSADLAGLKAPVTVVYDERRVPHIFAKSDEDFAFMQGYVTAKDRLWQMEVQVLATAGELSQYIGSDGVVENDRLMRRMGMKRAAEIGRDEMLKDPYIGPFVTAYVAGVNAWIEQLSQADLPVEYKILGYTPEPWTVLKTALLLKRMAYNLTGNTHDVEQTNTFHVLGDSLYAQFFPAFPDSVVPIIPAGTQYKFDTVRIDTPKNFAADRMFKQMSYPEVHENNGSNNWAVSGSKTSSGNPILCNDPHLTLSYPSIWYEIQGSTPSYNVRGVSLPGAPAVIIGFNENIAWGVTNASRDVLDWYLIEFKDDTRSEYKYNGEWRKTEKVIEEITIRGKETLYDTVIYTHHGPVVYDRNFGPDGEPVNMAMHWVAAQPSNEALTFYQLNRARNYDDYRAAIKHFACPGQNMVFASKENDIAITQQGKFPVKWPGQGDFVMDGSDPAMEWQSFIPMEENATIKNPARGFVSSANQHPTDSLYPYNVTGRYEYYRNRRINFRLAEMEKITWEQMGELQNDNFNEKASLFLPVMLKLIDEGKLEAGEKAVLATMRAWNLFNEKNLKEPSVFSEWSYETWKMIWADDIDHTGHPVEWPNGYTTGRLLAESPSHPVMDNRNTPARETGTEIVTQAFQQALKNLKDWSVENGDKEWVWYEYNNIQVVHLTRLKALSRFRIPMGGDAGIVNAAHGNHGPSWRMIVEMGETPKGKGIYPGGASGNPGSYFYDNMVDDWAAGNYYDLIFWKNADEAKAAGMATQEFKPAN